MNNLIKKMLNRETLVYLVFGVLTTAVDYISFAVFYYVLDLNEVLSNTIAWAFAVAFAYITNKLFVFNSKSFELKLLIKEISSFVIARIFSLVLTNIFLVLAGHIDMNMLLAKALTSVVVIIVNYIFSKLFIFNNNKITEEI